MYEQSFLTLILLVSAWVSKAKYGVRLHRSVVFVFLAKDIHRVILPLSYDEVQFVMKGVSADGLLTSYPNGLYTSIQRTMKMSRSMKKSINKYNDYLRWWSRLTITSSSSSYHKRKVSKRLNKYNWLRFKWWFVFPAEQKRVPYSILDKR